MQSLMMDTPLTITQIMRHAERVYPNAEVVSVRADNPLHRTTYTEIFSRARQLANALTKLGIGKGDRVATLAWNDNRHLELYYGIQCAGMVCHTINPRLFPQQVQYIVDHAEDRVIFVDSLIFPLVEKLASTLKTVEKIVVMTDRAHMPETSLDNVLCYEDLLAAESDDFEWPELSESDACALCYTSGTTGNPKGVLYNHRSTVIHAMAVNGADAIGFRNSDTILPVVPMFHVNAWSVPYAALMVGAKLVFPGPKMGDGETLADLMNGEQVSIALGVPTVWLGLLQHIQAAGKRLDSLERTVVGGSACPVSMMDTFREDYGVETLHAWGMTEMSPLGTLNSPPRGFDDLPDDKKCELRAKQGRPCFGVEMKIVDDDNTELPWDGKAFGSLKVRGPWVCRG
ncbi:long-chain fatty acid--CoA ligase [bacterium]|nr:long-chain fatty acid--CoA ligase [bacterium]